MSTKTGNSNLNPSLITRLKENVPEDEGLHDLDLSCSRIGPKEIGILGDVIKQNGLAGEKMAPLTTIDLTNNHICGVNVMGKGTYEADGMSDFLSALLALNKCSRLRKLTINRNSLNIKAISSLGHYVENVCAALSELNLRRTNITGEHFEKLAEGLKANKHLLYLDISENSLGTRGGLLLAEVLNSNSRIKQLDCSSCEIGVEGSVAIFTAMQTNATINTLIMNDNGFGDEACEVLGNMIKVHAKMRQLDIQENNIGHDGVAHIAKGLAKNRTLIHLGLQWNDLDNEGAARLAEAFLSNNVLKSLHILGNHIDLEGVKMIINANITITEKYVDLDVSYCYKPLKDQVRAEKKRLKSESTDTAPTTDGVPVDPA